MNVFDVHFSYFPLFRLFACKSTFVSLEAECKTIPEKPDALAGQTSPRREKFVFNGSRETRVSSLEKSCEYGEKREEGWKLTFGRYCIFSAVL